MLAHCILILALRSARFVIARSIGLPIALYRPAANAASNDPIGGGDRLDFVRLMALAIAKPAYYNLSAS